jgi:hypothetical protein
MFFELWDKNQTESQIAVAAKWIAFVTIRRAAVLRISVPTAAAIHSMGAL